MKKTYFSLVMMIILFSGLVLAAWHLPNGAWPSESVDNPQHITTYYQYALGRYIEDQNFNCPLGFTKFWQYCYDPDTQHYISGWVITNFSFIDASTLKIKTENRGEGCSGYYCFLGYPAYTKVFVANDSVYQGRLRWYYVGTVTTPYQYVIEGKFNVHQIGGNIHNVLVARSSYSGNHPDPRWYWLALID